MHQSLYQLVGEDCDVHDPANHIDRDTLAHLVERAFPRTIDYENNRITRAETMLRSGVKTRGPEGWESIIRTAIRIRDRTQCSLVTYQAKLAEIDHAINARDCQEVAGLGDSWAGGFAANH